MFTIERENKLDPFKDAKNVFINQERKLEDRRRSGSVLVLTINDVD